MGDSQNARMSPGASSCGSFHSYILIPLLPPRDFPAIRAASRRRSAGRFFFFIANYANYRGSRRSGKGEWFWRDAGCCRRR